MTVIRKMDAPCGNIMHSLLESMPMSAAVGHTFHMPSQPANPLTCSDCMPAPQHTPAPQLLDRVLETMLLSAAVGGHSQDSKATAALTAAAAQVREHRSVCARVYVRSRVCACVCNQLSPVFIFTSLCVHM